MPIKEQTQKVVKSFTRFWGEQDKKRKFLYIGILVCILLAAVIITVVLNKKDYVVLYEGLETEEASEMVALIEEMGYEAKLSGGSITVLQGTENDIIMKLSMQKYPKSGLNYTHSTKENDMFTTNAEFRHNTMLDTQDRLSAIIKLMENIDDAVVTLTDPEQKNTVIQSLRVEPTASIMVQLNGIEKLSNKQITGITHLVKNSWPGLKEENISIMDGNGIPQIVNAEEDYDFVLEETKKLAFKTKLENTIKDKIMEMLLPVYGEGGVVVAVNMILDTDKKASELTDYRPEDGGNTGVLQHGDVKEASGGQTVAGGVEGLEGNADDTYPTGDTGDAAQWTENEISNTYLVDTYKEQVTRAGYDIEGLSISVMVYQDYLSDAQKQDIMRLVAMAGTVPADEIENYVWVSNFPKYDPEADKEDVVPTYLFGLTFDQLILVGAIVLILIIVILVVMAVISGNAKKKRKEFEKQIIETSGFAANGEEPVDAFTFDESGEPIEVPSLTDDQIETKEVVIRREISEFAKYSPEIVAQLLKNWMKEENES